MEKATTERRARFEAELDMAGGGVVWPKGARVAPAGFH